jgi:hypothetical protein
MSENRPIHEIRLGRIKAAIWQNETEHGVRYSVSITRLYRKEERWETSTSFGRDDLPLVAKVADMAHTWIYQCGTESNGSANVQSQGGEQSTSRKQAATAQG